jgi:hypothetical protein
MGIEAISGEKEAAADEGLPESSCICSSSRPCAFAKVNLEDTDFEILNYAVY